MADWTPLQAIIWTCPPRLLATVHELLTERNLRPVSSIDGSAAPTTALALGQLYLSPAEALGSAARETGQALLRTAPGVAFQVWEDPAYGQLGTLVAHLPGVGTLTQACDAEGTPLWTAQEIADLIDEHQTRTDSTGPQQRALLVAEALEALRPDLTGPDTTPPAEG